MSHFTLTLAGVADANAVFSISRQNELFDEIRATGVAMEPVDTFARGRDAILKLWRVPLLRRQIVRLIRRELIDHVVVLMPHVWTPLVASAIRKTGTRYVVIVHDATPHPGDHTAVAADWLLRDATKADKVITLSRHVADALVARMPYLKARIQVLFHPILKSESPLASGVASHDTPGFLFFGRVMAYKGLPLFVEACERLRAQGARFRVGVVGEGALDALAPRLARLDAEVVNRWIDFAEIPPIFARYDAIVMPSVELSQSGVVSAAHGFGLPVIATPIGGLVEQVVDGRSGLLADAVSADAVAQAMSRFLSDADLRARLRSGVLAAQETHSPRRFYEALLEA